MSALKQEELNARISFLQKTAARHAARTSQEIAYGKIQSTLDYWKAKGYDLATDSNLHTLMVEVEQKIKFVENPGAFKAGLKRTRHGKFSRTHIANYSTKD